MAKYKDADLHSLLLKKSPFPEVSMQELVQQIKGRKVAEKKFPFLNQENIIFPPNLNLEQASSQDTADFKKQFFKGRKFIDLTCGFGIDAYFLSQNFEEITLKKSLSASTTFLLKSTFPTGKLYSPFELKRSIRLKPYIKSK